MSLISLDELPTDPVEALRELTRGEQELERVRIQQVRAAREAGVSWEQIGVALGVSRQAAWEYFNNELRSRLTRNVDANTDLTEDQAMKLSVQESRVVRRSRVDR